VEYFLLREYVAQKLIINANVILQYEYLTSGNEATFKTSKWILPGLTILQNGPVLQCPLFRWYSYSQTLN